MQKLDACRYLKIWMVWVNAGPLGIWEVAENLKIWETRQKAVCVSRQYSPECNHCPNCFAVSKTFLICHFQKTSRKKNQFIKGFSWTKISNFRPSRSTSHVSRCPPSIWLALRSHTELVKVIFEIIFILYFRFFENLFFSTSRACPRTPCSSAHQTLLTLSLSHRCPDSLSHKVPFYHKLIFTL